MIHVVLGMHKSGTTLVSQMLHDSGIDMDDVIDAHVSYDQGNKYERQSVLHLNLELLDAPDYSILNIARPATLQASPAQRDRIRQIVSAGEERYEDWGFKDPRTCLTYPLWAEALPPHRLIVVYREPGEVWPRYTLKRAHHFLNNFERAWQYLNRWYEHNAAILECLAATNQPHIVLSYRELMNGDQELRRLEEFVGRPLVDRRRGGLYRNRARWSVHLAVAERRLRRAQGRGTVEIMAALAAARRATGTGG